MKLKELEKEIGRIKSYKPYLEKIINEYKQFHIIIDDGSHYPKDVIKSFHLL